MPYLSKYHLGEQRAAVLLGPIVDTLRELEQRTAHSADRRSTSDEEQETIRRPQDDAEAYAVQLDALARQS
jgi:hypothetical protein